MCGKSSPTFITKCTVPLNLELLLKHISLDKSIFFVRLKAKLKYVTIKTVYNLYINFIKIRSIFLDLLHANTWTDRQTDRQTRIVNLTA